MKKQIITVAFLMTAAMFMTSCKNNSSESKKENSTTEQAENVHYQCPMKCEGDKTYDKPGQCPKCNMDLKKLDETHKHEENEHSH